MAFKCLGVMPSMRAAGFETRDCVFASLLMSSGLAFGSIVSLFGLEHGVIDRQQYTVLVTAVIASGPVPTVIAQKFFQPEMRPLRPEWSCGAQKEAPPAVRRAGRPPDL